jgi:glycosyltransferase involved in cell wall biosynthesis
MARIDHHALEEISCDPLVSTVVIFRDAERFLDEAIASVFAQKYANWELLLVDDGSADSSSELARGWAERHPDRVRYLTHTEHANRGMSASRNLGIAQARGEYLTFLDADDVWLPRKLTQQVALLQACPEAAMVYAPSQWWYSWTGRATDLDRDVVCPLGVVPQTLLRPPSLITPFFLRQQLAIPCINSIVVRREAVERVGGFEACFPGMYEDQAFFAKVCLEMPIIAAPDCSDRYRQHADSCVSSAERTGQAYAARLQFLGWLAMYLARRDIHDQEIERALDQEIRRCQHPVVHRLMRDVRQPGKIVAPLARRLGRRVLPAPAQRWLRSRLRRDSMRGSHGRVHLADLRRTEPLSRDFGFDRGQPVDRYYIDQFLAAHSEDIRGHVLEIADDTYARRFGGERVTAIDVLHVTGTAKATIVADLTDQMSLPSGCFDCVVITQTLQFIFDVPAALATIARILRPGGVVLATLPGITQISRYDMQRWGQYWSFTTLSARRLFEASFSPTSVHVDARGNVLAAVALLHGLSSEEIGARLLDESDSDYQVIVTVRAAKLHEIP